MNINEYDGLKKLVLNKGFELHPEHNGDEEVKFFDVISEMGMIRPASLLNAFHVAQQEGIIAELPVLLDAQPYCVTFENPDVQ